MGVCVYTFRKTCKFHTGFRFCCAFRANKYCSFFYLYWKRIVSDSNSFFYTVFFFLFLSLTHSFDSLRSIDFNFVVVIITSFSCPFSGFTILICCLLYVLVVNWLFFFSVLFKWAIMKTKQKFFMNLTQAVFGLHVDLFVNSITLMNW